MRLLHLLADAPYVAPHCRRVTDQLLQLLAVHHSSLRDLRLEWCCSVQGGSVTDSSTEEGPAQGTSASSSARGNSSGSSDVSGVTSTSASAAADLSSKAGGGAVAILPCFSEPALLGFLGACPRLRTVRLRHSAMLSSRFVQQLAGSCALLQLVALDHCDLAEVSQR